MGVLLNNYACAYHCIDPFEFWSKSHRKFHIIHLHVLHYQFQKWIYKTQIPTSSELLTLQTSYFQHIMPYHFHMREYNLVSCTRGVPMFEVRSPKPPHLQVGVFEFGVYVEGSRRYINFVIFILSVTEISLCEVNVHFPNQFGKPLFNVWRNYWRESSINLYIRNG